MCKSSSLSNKGLGILKLPLATLSVDKSWWLAMGRAGPRALMIVSKGKETCSSELMSKSSYCLMTLEKGCYCAGLREKFYTVSVLGVTIRVSSKLENSCRIALGMAVSFAP